MDLQGGYFRSFWAILGLFWVYFGLILGPWEPIKPPYLTACFKGNPVLGFPFKGNPGPGVLYKTGSPTK